MLRSLDELELKEAQEKERVEMLDKKDKLIRPYRLVVSGWYQFGKGDIYNTPVGIEMETGVVQSGTSFKIPLPESALKEIESAWEKHKVFPFFRLLIKKEQL